MSQPLIGKYIIISPVKEEEDHLPETIKSVVNQKVLPAKWIIVDDASTDKTPEIIAAACKEYSWIESIRIDRDTNRLPGKPVIEAFKKGLEVIRHSDFDYIVKLDCDLLLEPDYFSELITRFNENKKLGIASGVYLEKKNGTWQQIKMPDYHAAGASKFIRRECFDQIGGFVSSKGWDTIDEIKANVKGWETCHFKDLKFLHLKKEGSGIGQLKTNKMLGEIFYFTGGSKIFFVLKVIHKMIVGKPFLVAGFMMFYGYLIPFLKQSTLLVNKEEAKYYNNLLLNRLFQIR